MITVCAPNTALKPSMNTLSFFRKDTSQGNYLKSVGLQKTPQFKCNWSGPSESSSCSSLTENDGMASGWLAASHATLFSLWASYFFPVSRNLQLSMIAEQARNSLYNGDWWVERNCNQVNQKCFPSVQILSCVCMENVLKDNCQLTENMG